MSQSFDSNRIPVDEHAGTMWYFASIRRPGLLFLTIFTIMVAKTMMTKTATTTMRRRAVPFPPKGALSLHGDSERRE
jgi:hypothetical protein